MTKRKIKHKPSKSYLRRKADKLLQEYVRLKYGTILCYLCGENLCVVGHHFIYKSQSTATRYYLPNIIPLCKKCHFLIHAQPSFNAQICFKIGREWYDGLLETKKSPIKTTKEWYKNRIEEIEGWIEEEERPDFVCKSFLGI